MLEVMPMKRMFCFGFVVAVLMCMVARAKMQKDGVVLPSAT
jgi:hypothetical protein